MGVWPWTGWDRTLSFPYYSRALQFFMISLYDSKYHHFSLRVLFFLECARKVLRLFWAKSWGHISFRSWLGALGGGGVPGKRHPPAQSAKIVVQIFFYCPSRYFSKILPEIEGKSFSYYVFFQKFLYFNKNYPNICVLQKHGKRKSNHFRIFRYMLK